MSILDDILARKRVEIAADLAREPLELVRKRAATAPAARGFRAALQRPAGAPVRVIAEIKRASPSAGPIRPGADPAAIAREYAGAGATALSVLTDESFFDGHLSFLAAAHAAVTLPLLRKDFIVDGYQVAQARAALADAVLLIVAALDDAALRALLEDCRAHGLDALVEVHDADELRRAVDAGADLIGVNHRNLGDFTIDMALTAKLRPLAPADAVFVAESGIKTAADVRAMADAGADAILVGSSLMAAPSPGAALAELLR